MPKASRRERGAGRAEPGGTAHLRLALAPQDPLLASTSEASPTSGGGRHLRFIESLDRVNTAMQGSDDLEQMLTDVLDCVLTMFGCDRAWLVFPCDPEAPAWHCPMERTRPEYPGTFALGIWRPVDEQLAASWRTLLAAGGPLTFGSGCDLPMPPNFPEHFGIRSFIATVLHPKQGKPWLFGLHQCSYPRIWSAEETRLFQEIGRRLADGLSTLLTLRNLRQREAEARGLANSQARLNRALRLLSTGNQLLVHAQDEATLLNDVCRLLVESGHYLLAAVSFAQHDAEQSVRAVASYGRDDGYLDSIRVTWADQPRGRGPTGTAIRTGEVQIVQDLMGDPRMGLWHDAIRARGFRGSASLPLKNEQGTFGALAIYAAEPDAFIPEEIELLQELASDLAYGIRVLRTRAEHGVAQTKLAFMAHHDPLTQLPNRMLLRDAFDKSLAAAQRKGDSVALIFLDLDSFKEINDTLGHEVGDRLLVAVARRLQSCVRESDIVSREGGDEFVIGLTSNGQRAAERVAQQILRAMEAPFEINGNALHTSLSLGISMSPRDGKDFDTLRRNSDAAMFAAKDGGRNTYRFFDEQMNREVKDRMQMQAHLRCALKNHEFRLHFQPQVRLSDGRIAGAEALLRWQSPEGPLVPPGEFIHVAEQGGLIIPIGEWALNEACRQAMRWQKTDLRGCGVAVNLSVVQLRRGDILETVAAALRRSGLPASLLELELTESVLLQNTGTALDTLQALKRMGVRLSIDDFGTGYSSLSYLKRLAVDKLKIDGSFVRGLPESAEDAAIARAVIQLGHTLGLQVVAEGVETQAQFEFLRENGCDQVQGFLIAKPMPAEELPEAVQGASA